MEPASTTDEIAQMVQELEDAKLRLLADEYNKGHVKGWKAGYDRGFVKALERSLEVVVRVQIAQTHKEGYDQGREDGHIYSRTMAEEE